MASRAEHVVVLKAQDQTSQTFRTIGQSAQTAATQMQAAGRTAQAGLTQVDAAAKKADASVRGLGGTFGGFNASLAAFGASAATLTGILADAARAAAEEEAEFQRLITAVEATGASFDAHAVSVDRAVQAAQALSFADDQAVNALNTLTTTTGDAEKALDLLGLSMDLARGKGIDLATASGIIGKVAAGNMTILSRYGIVLDEGATSTEALAQIQARFSGQAKTFADSNVGAAQRIKNEFDNMLESVGSSTGEFQSLLLLLPGLSSGFTLLGGAASAATPAILAAGRASALFLAGLGPLGLALGAAALGAGLIAKRAYDAEQAGLAADAAFTGLTATIREMTEATNEAIIAQRLREIEEGLAAIKTRSDEAEQSLVDLASQQSASGTGVVVGLGMTEDVAKVAAENAAALDEQRASLQKLILSDAQWLNINSDLRDILTERSDIQRDLIIQADHILDDLRNGVIEGAAAEVQMDNLAAAARRGGAGLVGAGAAGDVAAEGFLTANQAAARLASDGLNKLEGFARSIRGAELDKVMGGITFDPDRGNKLAPFIAAEEKLWDIRNANLAKQREEQERIAEEARAQARETAQEQRRAIQDVEQARRKSEQTERRATRELANEREDIERQYNETVQGLAEQRIEAVKAAERSYTEQMREAQATRIDIAREENRAIRDLDTERRTVAEETESQLADLAQERGEIQRNLATSLAEAEREWHETASANARRQRDLRRELQRSTQEAAKEWQRLTAENARQLAELKEAIAEAQQERDVDIGRQREDVATDIQRIRDELNRTLNDPTVSNAAKAEAEIRANERILDLQKQLQRGEEDFARETAQAQDEAREREEELLRSRAESKREFERNRRAEERETTNAIKTLVQELTAAEKEHNQEKAGLRADASSRLRDLANQESEILAGQQERFNEIEHQMSIVVRDANRERRNLATETANIEQARARETKDAQIQYVAAARTAYEEANAARSQAESDFQRQVNEGQRGLQREIKGAVRVGVDRTAFDEGITQIAEDVAELDGPILDVRANTQPITSVIRNSYSGKTLAESYIRLIPRADAIGQYTGSISGQVLAEANVRIQPNIGAMNDYIASVNAQVIATSYVRILPRPASAESYLGGDLAMQRIPRAALGMTLVGEFGPELLIHGNQIMPHGAAQARVEAENSGGKGDVRIYGNVTVVAQTADIGREISRQLASRGRM